MGYRPPWRLSLLKRASTPAYQSPAFKEARRKQLPAPPERQCHAIVRRTGERCRKLAMRGTDRCQVHGGRTAAAEAEQARYDKPVVILRRRRQKELATLGAGPWPDGLPTRPDLVELGPLARGRLFEAWMNREMDPATWRHELTRKRTRDYKTERNRTPNF